MSSSDSKEDLQNLSAETNAIYRPGTFRYQDLPASERKKKFDERQQELNPCLKESEMASTCLLLVGEDYHKCEAQIENYKTCKKFWTAVRAFATTNHLLRNDGFPPLAQRPIWKKQLNTWIQTKKLTVPEEIKPLV